MDQNVWRKRTVLVSLTTTTTVLCVIFINLFKSCEGNSFLQVENERPVPTHSLLNFSPQLFDQAKLATVGNPDSSPEGHKSKHRSHSGKKSKHRNKTGHHKRKHHKKKKNKTRHGSRITEHPYIVVPSTTPKQPVPVVVQNSAVESIATLNLQDLAPKTATNEFSFPILNNPVEIVKPVVVQKPEKKEPAVIVQKSEQHEPAVSAQAPKDTKTVEKIQEEPSSQNQQKEQKQQQREERPQQKEERPQQKEERPQQKEERQQQKEEKQQQKEEKQQQKEEKRKQKEEKHQQMEEKEQQREHKHQKNEEKQQHEQKKQQKEQKHQKHEHKHEQQEQRVPIVQDLPAGDGFGRSLGSSKSETPVKNYPSVSNQQQTEPKAEESFQRKSEPASEPLKLQPVPVEIQKVEIKTTSRPEFWVRQDLNVEESEPENLLEPLNEEKRALKKKKFKKNSKLGRGKSIGRKAGKKAGKAAAAADGASSEKPPVTGEPDPVTEGPSPGPVTGEPSAGPPVTGGQSSLPPPGGSSLPPGGSTESPPDKDKIVPWIDFPDTGDNGNGTGGNGSRFDPAAALPTQEEYDLKCKTTENMESKTRCQPVQFQLLPVEPVDPKSKNVDDILNWYASEGKRISGKYEDKPTYNVERQNRKLAITTIKNALDAVPDLEMEPLNGFKLLNTTKWIFETVCPSNIIPPQFLDMIVTAFKRIYEQVGRDRRPFLNDVEYGWIDNTLRTCVETAVPANYVQDNCKEEVYAVDANANLLCLGHMTNGNKHLQSTACFQTDLRTFDPVLDVVWLMFEAAKATCFESFQGNSRLLHRYSAAIMDLFTRPLKFRWPLESGGIKFWERILGPGVDLYLRNIDKCLHQIVQTSSLNFRTPRFLNTHTVRLSNTLTEFIDLP